MAGAFLSLLETGTALRSLELQLGDPELEAAIYNLVLFVEQAGPIGMAVAWVVGVIVILVVRGVALALVGMVWRATSTWARPRPAPPPAIAPPPTAPAPTAPGPSRRLGPWSHRAKPAFEAPAPATPPAPVHRPVRPIVERSPRPTDATDRDGAVVLQRPRGHMDGS